MNERTNKDNMPLHIDATSSEYLKDKNVVCLVDGEHYPPVIKGTLKSLRDEGSKIVGLVFLGGTEKIEDPIEELKLDSIKKDLKIYAQKDEKVGISHLLNSCLVENEVDCVIDLSDEPIVNYEDRFQIAAVVLSYGVKYLGADFVLQPPLQKEVLEKPSLSIVGTGKRIGKTGVSVSIARLLDERGYDPVVVCMGRGGPQQPVLVDTSDRKVDAEMLLSMAESGKHAASDYLEDALLADVPTVGCRRCGGGFSGNPFSSNVVEGAEMANEVSRSFVIMEGSGSTFPPIKTDSRIVLIGAAQPLDHILKYLGQYRIRSSDLAIVTMCEEPIVGEEKVSSIEEGIKRIKPDLNYLLTKFRPEPSQDVSGQKVFVASTAPGSMMPTIENYLEENFGCEVVGSTNNLSDRKKLRKDLESDLDRAEVLLTEIKAASIDIAGRYAKETDVDITFMHNETLVIGGSEESLEKAVRNLCDEIIEEVKK